MSRFRRACGRRRSRFPTISGGHSSRFISMSDKVQKRLASCSYHLMLLLWDRGGYTLSSRSIVHTARPTERRKFPPTLRVAIALFMTSTCPPAFLGLMLISESVESVPSSTGLGEISTHVGREMSWLVRLSSQWFPA